MTMNQVDRNDLQAAKEHYDREGYAVFRNVIDGGLIQEASDHVAWLMRQNPGLRPEQLGHTLMRDDPFWVRLISDDRLLDIAELFVGPNIALFASHYISKPPYDGQPVLWHQDGSFWPLDPMEVVTLWLAVDDSTPENGCMRVIPGTHTLDLQGMQPLTEVTNVLNRGLDPARWTSRGRSTSCSRPAMCRCIIPISCTVQTPITRPGAAPASPSATSRPARASSRTNHGPAPFCCAATRSPA